MFHSIWPAAKQHSALYYWRLTVHWSDLPALSSWHNSLLHELTQHVKGFSVSSPVYPSVILNLIRSASCVSHGDSKFISFSQLCIPWWPVRSFGLIICEYHGESEFSFIYIWYCFIICTHIEFWLPFHAICGNQLSELIIWYIQMNIKFIAFHLSRYTMNIWLYHVNIKTLAKYRQYWILLINFDWLAFIWSNLSIQYKNFHWANTAKTSPIRIYSLLAQFQAVQ